jgi:hypothetical protein
MAATRHGLVSAALAALLLLAPVASARPVDVSVTPIPLDPADLTRVHVGRLAYMAGLHLRSDDPAFGGLSGLVVEGDRAIMVSDKGRWVLARLRHDATGQLNGLYQVEIGALLDAAGRPVQGGRDDAEAVARLADGRLLVSFERRHRLWAYAPGTDPLNARPAALPVPRDLARADSNGGLEAVVEMAPGQRLALSESLRHDSGDLVGWYLAGRGVAEVRYATDGAFVPTDLARLPSGDLLVLERRFSLLGGVAGQVRLIPYAQLGQKRLEPLPVARLEPPLAVDNMEGIAAVERDGEVLVYILSDDNFSALQRTLLLQFRLLPAE